MSFHKTIVVGNVGRTPEMRYTQDGKAVTNFSVAVNEKFGDTERVTWYRVACWNGLAESVNEYVIKGTLLLVEGRVHVESWTDKTTGEPRAGLNLTAQTVKFLNGTRPRVEETEETEDEVPF